MRASLCVRTAKSALSADPTKTHVHDRSPLWKKVREALVVNPDIHTGSPLVLEHRWPQPASRPETFTVPASKASDVADNAYFKRDFRRMYPKTSVVTQEELATLLIAQGGFTSCVHSLRATKLLGERMRDLSAMERRAETLFVTLCSLPAPPTASSSEKALTADSPAPSLAAIYNSGTSVATASFKPPVPPGMKYKWSPAAEVLQHGEFAYFPMYSASCHKIGEVGRSD